jgi:dTDP-4-dehydrorhamnose reductase
LGKGYLGGEVTSYLNKSGYKIFNHSRSELDYHNQADLYKFIINNNINCVINCSGFTGRPNVDEAESKKELCWDLNVVIPQQVAKTCHTLGVKLIHISSGCIYSGYSKPYTEEDTPNFGIFDESSFYSKSKHAFETMTRDLNVKILRIRMPICYDITSPRNYLTKIMNYPNLINMVNSKTFLPDLCGFIDTILTKMPNTWWLNKQDIYNIVNPDPMTTFDVVSMLNTGSGGGWKNLDPIWITMSELDTIAPRSNCILDNFKASAIYKFNTEYEFMRLIIKNINGVSAV